MRSMFGKFGHQFVLLLLCVAAGWLYGYAMQGPGVDRAVFRYAGMTIANGGTPYADFFDHKPPLVYFFYTLAHPFGINGPQYLFTLLVFGVSLWVFRACEKRVPQYKWPLTVLWIAMLHDPLVMADGGQNRLLSALLITIVFVYGLTAKSIRWWSLGALLSGIFFTQQTDLPALLPFVLWLLFRKENVATGEPVRSGKKGILKRILLLAAGFVVPALLLLVWFYSRNALPAFIYDAFTFNRRWYIDAAYTVPKISYVAVMLAKTAYILPFGLCLLQWKKLNRTAFPAVLFGAGIQAMLLVPGFFFNHYFLSFIPYAFFGWLLLLENIQGSSFFQQPSAKRLLVAGFLLLMVFYIKPLHWFSKNNYAFEKTVMRQMAPYANEVAGRPGQLFGFDQTPFLNLNANYNIASPSKWLYFHFWLRPGWDVSLDTFRNEVLKPLDSFRCTYVMDRENGITVFHPQLKQLWQDYINQKYALIFEIRSAGGKRLFRLLKRKPTPVE